MTAYEAREVIRAMLGAVVVLATGGFIAYASGLWPVSLCVAGAIIAISGIIVQAAETEPIATSEPTSVLDVLEPPRH